MKDGTRLISYYIKHLLNSFSLEGSRRGTVFFSFRMSEPGVDTETKARSRQRSGDHSQGLRRQSVPQSQPNEWRERQQGNKDQDMAARGGK